MRFISNRSSGKMGYAVAEAAPRPGGIHRDRGRPNLGACSRWRNSRTCGDCPGDARRGGRRVPGRGRAGDGRRCGGLAAGECGKPKIKKSGAKQWTIEVTRTPDIVAEVEGSGLIKVGFAAESQDLESNAREKLAPKGLHLIAANDITADDSGFSADTNRVVLIDRDGGVEEPGLMSKYEVGHRILDRVVAFLG